MSDSEEVGLTSHDYSGINISGEAHVQLGDHINHFYYVYRAQGASSNLQYPEGSEYTASISNFA